MIWLPVAMASSASSVPEMSPTTERVGEASEDEMWVGGPADGGVDAALADESASAVNQRGGVDKPMNQEGVVGGSVATWCSPQALSVLGTGSRS